MFVLIISIGNNSNRKAEIFTWLKGVTMKKKEEFCLILTKYCKELSMNYFINGTGKPIFFYIL